MGPAIMLRLMLVLALATPCVPFPIPGVSHVPVQHPKLAAKPSTFHGVPLLSKSGRAPAPGGARLDLADGQARVGAGRTALKMQAHGAVGELLDDLLLQRAVQTELVYFREFGDDFKVRWLEDFLDHEGLASFHGFGGLRVSAVEYLHEMLNSAPVEQEVKMKWGSRLAGGSKNNPFLQQQPKYKFYKDTLHPQKICKGIMDIREQLKAEWISDIPVMAEEDANFATALRRKAEALSDQMHNLSGVASTRTLGKDSRDPARPTVELKGGLVQSDDEELEVGQQGFALLRDDMNSLGVREGSTPLRSQNYDVLKKAATYIAVKRVMAHWARDGQMEGALQWFKSRWDEKYMDSMRGDSGRHLSERFLTNIANSPPAAVNTLKGGLQMVTPARLAMDIIEERKLVVKSFVDWLQTARVEEEHVELQRELLSRSMETPSAGAEPERHALEAMYRVSPGEGPEVPKQDIEALWKPRRRKDGNGEVVV